MVILIRSLSINYIFCFSFKKKAILFLFFLFTIKSFSQINEGTVSEQFVRKHYTNADGLNNLQCFTIEESLKDQYYISTQDGLNLLDGTGIKKYFTTEDGIILNKIVSINNNIYGTIEDESKLFISTNNFKRLINFDNKNKIIKNANINFLNKDTAIISYNCNDYSTNFVFLNLANYKFSQPFTLQTYIQLFKVESNGGIIAYNNTQKCIFYFLENFKIKDTFFINNSIEINEQSFYNPEGIFFTPVIKNCKIELEKGLKFKKSETCNYAKIFLKKNILVYVDNGILYIIKNNIKYDLGKFTAFINSTYIDQQNNLWICAQSGLFNYYKNGIKKITLNGISNELNQVDFIDKKDNNWILSSILNGFVTSNNNLNNWKYDSDVNKLNKKFNYGNVGKTRNGSFFCKDGTLFFPIKNILIVKKNNSIKHYYLSKNEDDRVVGIVNDSLRKNSYLLTNFSLFRYSHFDNSIVMLFSNSKIDKHGYFCDIVLRNNGDLVLGSNKVELYKNSKLTTLIEFKDLNKFYFAKSNDESIWIAKDKLLWLLKKDDVAPTYVAEIFNNSIINSMVFYKKFLVFGSWYELIFFDTEIYKSNKKIVTYQFGKTNGLYTYKGGIRSLLSDEKNNCIYWPCNDNFYKIFPEIILANYTIYEKPIINNIYANNFTEKNKEVADSIGSNKISLNEKYRNLFFNVGFSYQINTNRPNIRYRLLGYQKKWFTTTTTDIRYYNLPSGKYQLEIQLSLNSDNWSESTFSNEIIIQSYWYETLLFKILVVLAIAGLLYLLYAFRIRQLKKIIAVRKKISADLHDDIGSTLSSINMYSQVAQLQENVSPHINTIQENTKEALEKLDDIVWATNPKNDKLENLIERIQNFAKSLLNAKQINFIFNYDTTIKTTKINEATRQTLFLIIKEAINNLAKYAEAANCNLDLHIKNKTIYCIITDDGNGFDTNTPTERNGLLNMQNRTTALKGKFEINSEINKGTIIKVQLPL